MQNQLRVKRAREREKVEEKKKGTLPRASSMRLNSFFSHATVAADIEARKASNLYQDEITARGQEREMVTLFCLPSLFFFRQGIIAHVRTAARAGT